jgi:hypothetical protein
MLPNTSLVTYILTVYIGSIMLPNTSLVTYILTGYIGSINVWQIFNVKKFRSGNFDDFSVSTSKMIKKTLTN